MNNKPICLFTAIHPGSVRFLMPWYESLMEQTDQDYDLWVCLDGVEPDQITEILGTELKAHWVPGKSGDTPVQVRQRALLQIVKAYSAVIFVDSDDMLMPTRVERAKLYLRNSDLTACAMNICLENGSDTGLIFAPPGNADLSALLINNNIFGLTNSAYRCDLLERCLPVPHGCCLMDWFVATRGWLLKARMSFDYSPNMVYRQYSSNTAKVIPPFEKNEVLGATAYVKDHYNYILKSSDDIPLREQKMLTDALKEVETFYNCLVSSGEVAGKYIEALNKQDLDFIWWNSIAHPELKQFYCN